MRTYLSTAIQLIFAAQVFSRILTSSSSTEGVDHSKKPNINYFPCYEKYILKSYFTNHETFHDSSFQDFIANELRPNQVLAFAKVSDLKRRLIGEGSHRLLSSSITFSILLDSASDPSMQHCKIILIERLPSGVFADPFELEHLLQRGVFEGAAVFGDTNLELPSFLSNRSIVEVHVDAALNVSSGQKDALDLKIEIPLHARYPLLEESGYSQVRFGLPDLFVQCNREGESSIQDCSVTAIIAGTDLKPDTVMWNIPSGVKDHARVVSVITFASALLSAMLIIIASVKHSGVGSLKIFKQS
ncbi:hypothetical protein Ancab_033037 [Ancistrocladus abbreviatus]